MHTASDLIHAKLAENVVTKLVGNIAKNVDIKPARTDEFSPSYVTGQIPGVAPGNATAVKSVQAPMQTDPRVSTIAPRPTVRQTSLDGLSTGRGEMVVPGSQKLPDPSARSPLGKDIIEPPKPASVPTVPAAPGPVKDMHGVPVGKAPTPRWGAPTPTVPDQARVAAGNIGGALGNAAEGLYSLPQRIAQGTARALRTDPNAAKLNVPGSPVGIAGNAVDVARNTAANVMERVGATRGTAAATAATGTLGAAGTAAALAPSRPDQQIPGSETSPTAAPADGTTPATPAASTPAGQATSTAPAATPAPVVDPRVQPFLDKDQAGMTKVMGDIRTNADAEFRKANGLAADAQLDPTQQKQLDAAVQKQQRQVFTDVGYASKTQELDKILSDPNSSTIQKVKATAEKTLLAANRAAQSVSGGRVGVDMSKEVQTQIANGVKATVADIKAGADAAIKADTMPGIMDMIKSNPSALLVPAGLLMMLFGGKAGLVLGGLAAAYGGKQLYDRYKGITSPEFQQDVAKSFEGMANMSATEKAAHVAEMNKWVNSPSTDPAEATRKQNWAAFGLVSRWAPSVLESRLQDAGKQFMTGLGMDQGIIDGTFPQPEQAAQ